MGIAASTLDIVLIDISAFYEAGGSAEREIARYHRLVFDNSLSKPTILARSAKPQLEAFYAMIDVQQIVALHRHTTELWHQQDLVNAYADLLHVVCEQHRYNFLLWHEEDIARSPEVGDQRIAAVKRAIDKYNQQRNDAIEQIDDHLKRELDSRGVVAAAGAKLNTETPGQAIDRLSILALRIYHMQEQLVRTDVDVDHLSRVRGKLEILHTQHDDLCAALAELLADIFAGRKQLKLYRQFKMYNDPTLNPYLYQGGMRKAG